MKRSGQWGMSHVSKKFKNIRSFLPNTGRKKLWQILSQQAAQLNGISTISAKTLALPSLL